MRSGVYGCARRSIDRNIWAPVVFSELIVAPAISLGSMRKPGRRSSWLVPLLLAVVAGCSYTRTRCGTSVSGIPFLVDLFAPASPGDGAAVEVGAERAKAPEWRR